MRRRHFLARFSKSFAIVTLPPAFARAAVPTCVHLQDCRIAGSHHYDCIAAIVDLCVGDRLTLRRQPGNRHDTRAVEVFRNHLKLGYLPRQDNAAAASLLDRGHALHGEIAGIDDPALEWEPLRLRIWLADAGRKS